LELTFVMRDLKVGIVSYNDSEGGADRAAYRLHRSLIKSGIKSTMYVNVSNTKDNTVVLPGGKYARVMSQLRPRLGRVLQKFYNNGHFGRLSLNILPSKWPKILNESDADIIHLHWPHNEMMSISDISRIQKPIVWTLHDMWVFCGAEHYITEDKFRYKYGNESNYKKNSIFDINYWNWKRKLKYWKNPIHIITPSKWMGKLAESSKIISDWNVKVIANAIDTDYWKPIPKQIAKEMLGFQEDRPLMLFGAIGGTSDPRKGFDILKEVLTKIPADHKNKPALLIIGERCNELNSINGLDIYALGHFYDDVSLKLIYNAVDLVMIPSRQDNLPNFGVEALACGVPVVAFNTGGLSDIIKHRENGWLAEAFDITSFAEGINWILEDEDRKKLLSSNARNYAVTNYSFDVVSKKHLQFYTEVVQSDARSLFRGKKVPFTEPILNK